MKNLILTLTFLSYTLCNISAQIDELGITIGNNFASHTNSDPTIPEDGQFQWNNLNGLNIGIYTSKKLNTRWSLRSSINFQQKGYTEIAQISDPFQSFGNTILRNRLSYLTFSFQGTFHLNPKNDKVILSLFSGLENNILMSRTLDSKINTVVRNSYPTSEYQDNWKNYHLNYLFGFRALIYNSIGLSAFHSRSLSPVLKTDRLVVKDWIWGLSIDFNLEEMIKWE